MSQMYHVTLLDSYMYINGILNINKIFYSRS